MPEKYSTELDTETELFTDVDELDDFDLSGCWYEVHLADPHGTFDKVLDGPFTDLNEAETYAISVYDDLSQVISEIPENVNIVEIRVDTMVWSNEFTGNTYADAETEAIETTYRRQVEIVRKDQEK